MKTCEHFQNLPKVTAKTPKGCEECLKTNGKWVQLRLCLGCGHVGCCDSSPGKHATAHFKSTGHPAMESFEPGQAWKWCYIHEEMFKS